MMPFLFRYSSMPLLMMMMTLIEAMHGTPSEPSLKRCLTLPFTSLLPNDPRHMGQHAQNISSAPRADVFVPSMLSGASGSKPWPRNVGEVCCSTKRSRGEC